MSETVLSSSSNSVDKAIDKYHDPSIMIPVVLVALVIVVIAIVVVEETPRTSTRLVFLGFL